MSRHQAYRNYDYEEDLDEYEGAAYSDEEEELSPEDRAQMSTGTAQVQAALGAESTKVTTKQIQEALWHYYYDVDKSTSYLMSNFFFDMPWLNVPKSRQTIFIEPPARSGGLLGGASTPARMSKLQVLAAARKRKADAQKTQVQDTEVQKTTQRMNSLNIEPSSADAAKENARPSLESSHDALESGSRIAPKKPKHQALEPPTDLGQNGDAEYSRSATLRPADHRMGDPAPPPEAIEPAKPSAFAKTLLGSDLRSNSSCPTTRSFPLPYMSFTLSIDDAFSEPSPDDVVLTAQSKASNKKLAATTSKKKDGADKKGDAVTSGVKALEIDDSPLPKSKNLDVLSEFEKSKSKKSASFVVVGHVDAGKSTLMGRLLVDLDVVDQRTLQKYRKEAESIGKSSFALAWVLDQRSEERTRGVTIDVATNKFETENTSFTILDAPGHRDFIPNMIAGASQADFAILVVDASTGAFEAGLKGQTREHSLLLRSMGVSRIIVAVNKLDTVGWSQERFDEISQQVSGFLSATGFQLKHVSFVPVSGLQGDNLVNKSSDAAAGWYGGNTLITELESSEPMTRALTKPLRLTISEVFRSAQGQLTISGRLDAGSLQAGDALLVQPSGEKAYVKSLELDSEAVEWAVAGQNVVMHLSNIDPVHVRVGDIVCDPKQPIACVDSFTVKVLAFDILMPMQVDVHRGRLHAAGQISEMPALLDKVKGTVLKKRPKIVKPASIARLVVKMASRVPLEAGQRVVLRSAGETVAAGLLE
ncbi:hypothetical protein GGR56DRAFT_665551 [Xylariaceae sp. FL0804]|nr:hypothetical protein GGR56DRAFT_665551 [Xylariaceae sp. FL0804]